MGFDLWGALGVSPQTGLMAVVGALVVAGLLGRLDVPPQPVRCPCRARPLPRRLSPRAGRGDRMPPAWRC